MTPTSATGVYAVIGNPVRHSLSPIMHNGWIEDHGFDAVYVALELNNKDPVAALRTLGTFGVRGANVTVPYKEAAAAAARSGSLEVANVLRWDESGALTATNTDGQGFLRALSELSIDWRTYVRRVLIVGAGGAGQGIAHAISPFVDIVAIANRTAARAESAARELANGRVLEWADLNAGFSEADLVVQATTLGMDSREDHPWPISACKSSAIVADVVYRPLETSLLRAARRLELRTMDGLGMLIHQGALSFEYWFGVAPDVSKARARLRAALGA